MNEIVFESRNKEYGAFLHRTQYQRYLAKALAWAIGIFVLSVVTPLFMKKMGWIKEPPVQILDTFQYVLQQPPSINPSEPEKEVPKVEEVRRPTKEDLELLASKKEEIKDTTPLTNNEKKNNPSNNKTDTSGGSRNGNGTHGSQIYNMGMGIRHAEYPGGDEAYNKFLSDNQNNSKELQELYDDGIKGTVKVYFVLNEDGSREQISVRTSSGYKEFDEEAIRLIKLMPNFIPAMKGNIPVRVHYFLEVKFGQ